MEQFSPQHMLDKYLGSLASLPPVTLQTVDASGQIKPLAVVSMATLLPMLAPSYADLRGDLDKVVPQIVHWGRIMALQKRVWVARSRELRVWKAQQELATRKGWTKEGTMSGDQAEAHYRTASDYAAVEAAEEAAEEAFLFADVVYRAFKEKREVLQKDVFAGKDGSLQRLS